MNDYVPKPISPQQLVEVLEQWLPGETAQSKEHLKVMPQGAVVATGKEPIIPVFGAAVLMTRLMDDEKLVLTVCRGYLDELPKTMAALQGCLETDDVDGATRVAHSIRGAAGNIGGEALRAAAHAMEQAGKTGDIASARGNMPELEVQTARLTTAIEQYIQVSGGQF